VTDVVSQAPHKMSHISSSKAASSSARPSVRVGVMAKVGARVRDRVRATETVLYSFTQASVESTACPSLRYQYFAHKLLVLELSS
jgi:hypothetical protein